MPEKTVIVPLGGNSFILNKPQSQEDNIEVDGWRKWSSMRYVYGVFFKTAVDAKLDFYLDLNAQNSESVIEALVGNVKNTVSIHKGDARVFLGSFETKKGYVELQIKGISREGKVFAHPYSITLVGISDSEMASYARESDKNDFYWIRRGPSVHCGYDLSTAGDDVEWFYNEVTINPGDDPHGTYGMAIGFHGGYFGMQVVDNGKKKLIFSIWSPYTTDNPNEIPEDKRVKVLKKRKDVNTGEFGNEGSGGQSFCDYEWKSGETYKFLCHIVPRENNKTEFTGYFFFPETGKWELLCSFLRPETNTYFKGAYSFLESFIDVNGNRFRRVYFGNQWACTKGGRWFPVNTMRLTGDTTARKAQRQDYGGGIEGGRFYLNNCGFFSDNSTLDTVFTIDPSEYKNPEINLESLEKAE